jgi:hypothetical protein
MSHRFVIPLKSDIMVSDVYGEDLFEYLPSFFRASCVLSAEQGLHFFWRLRRRRSVTCLAAILFEIPLLNFPV